MAKAKKSVLPVKGQDEHPKWLWADTEFEERCPALYEFLACGIVDDEVRKGGSISLFCGQGRLKVCFLDKQTQMAFYACLEARGELWAELEGILAGEHEAWSPVRSGSGGKPVF